MSRRCLPLLVAACLCLTGCDRNYFRATGAIQSYGGDLGRWRSSPQGCSRDPFDGMSTSQTSSVLTFLWENPADRDLDRDRHRPTAPDAPMRMEISHLGSSYAVGLTTVKTEGTQFDLHSCRTFAIESQQAPPAIPEGRPTLKGTVQFDCQVKGGRIAANVHFDRCEY